MSRKWKYLPLLALLLLAVGSAAPAQAWVPIAPVARKHAEPPRGVGGDPCVFVQGPLVNVCTGTTLQHLSWIDEQGVRRDADLAQQQVHFDDQPAGGLAINGQLVRSYTVEDAQGQQRTVNTVSPEQVHLQYARNRDGRQAGWVAFRVALLLVAVAWGISLLVRQLGLSSKPASMQDMLGIGAGMLLLAVLWGGILGLMTYDAFEQGDIGLLYLSALGLFGLMGIAPLMAVCITMAPPDIPIRRCSQQIQRWSQRRKSLVSAR